jgi:hypothetical protein
MPRRVRQGCSDRSRPGIQACAVTPPRKGSADVSKGLTADEDDGRGRLRKGDDASTPSTQARSKGTRPRSPTDEGQSGGCTRPPSRRLGDLWLLPSASGGVWVRAPKQGIPRHSGTSLSPSRRRDRTLSRHHRKRWGRRISDGVPPAIRIRPHHDILSALLARARDGPGLSARACCTLTAACPRSPGPLLALPSPRWALWPMKPPSSTRNGRQRGFRCRLQVGAPSFSSLMVPSPAMAPRAFLPSALPFSWMPDPILFNPASPRPRPDRPAFCRFVKSLAVSASCLH